MDEKEKNITDLDEFLAYLEKNGIDTSKLNIKDEDSQ